MEKERGFAGVGGGQERVTGVRVVMMVVVVLIVVVHLCSRKMLL